MHMHSKTTNTLCVRRVSNNAPRRDGWRQAKAPACIRETCSVAPVQASGDCDNTLAASNKSLYDDEDARAC